MSEWLSSTERVPFEEDSSEERGMGSMLYERELLIVLHSRALDLLSRCSPYVPESLKGEIEHLAGATGRTTLIPVRIERVDGTVLIDPYGVAG